MSAIRKLELTLRVKVSLLAALLLAVVLDVWIRLTVLPWYRKTDERWSVIWNRLIKIWGIGTTCFTRVGMNMKIRVEGNVPESGRYIIISNHQSSIDTPAIISLFRSLNLKFVANDGLLQGKPGVSVALRNGGFGCVAKNDRDEDMKALKDFAEGLESYDACAVIFPEGIRPDRNEMLPFHLGGAELVTRVGRLPLLPIVHDGLWKARSIKELAGLLDATLTFRVLDPIPFEEFEKAPWETLENVERTIRRNLDDIRKIS